MGNKLVAPLFALAFLSTPIQANYLEEMGVLDAQIQLVNKRAELQAALNRSAGSITLPRISTIVVDDAGAVAQVVYESGLIRWVKEKDVIAEDTIVTSITSSSVSAQIKGKTFALRYVSAEPNQPNNSTSVPQDAPQINLPRPVSPTLAVPPQPPVSGELTTLPISPVAIN